MEVITTESESREKQGEKIIQFLEKTHAYEFFQSLKEEKAEHITAEEFIDFVVRLNGIIRDTPIHERGPDGDGVVLENWIETVLVPRHADKEPLLKHGYEARIDLKNQGDEKYMLPAVVNAVHLFEDGNGRTSRLLNVLLTPCDSPEEFYERARKALGINGRFDSLNVNPGLIKGDLEKIVLENHGFKFRDMDHFSPVAPERFTRLFTIDGASIVNPSHVIKEFMDKRKGDGWYSFLAAYAYLRLEGLLERATAVRTDFPDLDLEEDYKALSWKKMGEILTEPDWKNILDDYYALKAEEVEILIDCFVSPDKYKAMDGKATLRERFLEKIHADLQSYT